jgi:hypothetical protein
MTTYNLSNARSRSWLPTHPLQKQSSKPFAQYPAGGNRRIYPDFGGRVLLVGDLNMTSWSPFFSDLIQTSGLRDSRKGFGMQNSWPANRRLLMIPIDHILVSEGVKVLSRRIGQFNGSDHYPILLDFSLSSRIGSVKTNHVHPTNKLINGDD